MLPSLVLTPFFSRLRPVWLKGASGGLRRYPGSRSLKSLVPPVFQRVASENGRGSHHLAKGFTNHEQTDPSGLIYMQARFYAPWYGRFLSPDPARDQHFEETQSWNIYSYVQNNPTMNIDPTGMYSWSEFGSDAWGVTKGIGTAVGKVAVGIGKAVYQSARVSTDPGYAAKAAVSTVQGAISGTKELVNNVKAEGGVGGALSAAYNQALDNYQGASAAGKAEMIATPLVETFAVLAGGAEGAKAPTGQAGSSMDGLNLQKQLASEAQVGEAGTSMAGAGGRATFRDAGRVAGEYGGNAADWSKKSSSTFTAKDGTKFETHWVENSKTGQRQEYKTKFPDKDK